MNEWLQYFILTCIIIILVFKSYWIHLIWQSGVDYIPMLIQLGYLNMYRTKQLDIMIFRTFVKEILKDLFLF